MDTVAPISETSIDYRAAFVELGSRLAFAGESEIITVISDVELDEPQPLPLEIVTLQELRYSFAGYRGDVINLELYQKADEPEISEAVQTFLESQEPYTYLELPANVSYDMPAIPFEYALPVAEVSCGGFGYRLHPIDGVVKFHYGTDVSAAYGSDILAFADGVVTYAGSGDGYGLYVTIAHESGFTTLYAHCSELLVSAGDSVTMGQVIARAGATGKATGPHLHFEIQCDGTYLNPEYYIA